MDRTFLKVPVILWLMVIFIFVVVALPNLYMSRQILDKVDTIERNQNTVTVTASPSATVSSPTPTATPTPVKKVITVPTKTVSPTVAK